MYILCNTAATVRVGRIPRHKFTKKIGSYNKRCENLCCYKNFTVRSEEGKADGEVGVSMGDGDFLVEAGVLLAQVLQSATDVLVCR